MTIRARLTLWYAAILLISLVVLSVVVYIEFNEQLQMLRVGGRQPETVEHEVGEIIVYYGLPTALLLLAGGWWLTRKALAPVTALTHAVERIHVNNLKDRLPCAGQGDELDRLTEVFNAMTARLDDSFTHIREFTLHASHELKTPLTVLRAELETALRDQDCTPAQQTMYASQIDEIQRLARIVDGLTLLARADAGQVELASDAVPLDELVHDSFADAQMLAVGQGIEVQLGVCDEVMVRGDRHRLRQLLLNLADNAVKYNQPKGRVTIALQRNGVAAQLRICNTGPGIATTVLPRVFDRFFRGDPAHNHDVEGCGLGLNIAQWIVRAHGGDIQIASEPDQLTTVTVNLPLHPAPGPA